MAKLTPWVIGALAAAGVGAYIMWRRRQPPQGIPMPAALPPGTHRPAADVVTEVAAAPQEEPEPVVVPWYGPGAWDVAGTGQAEVASSTSSEAEEAREQQRLIDIGMCFLQGGVWCENL